MSRENAELLMAEVAKLMILVLEKQEQEIQILKNELEKLKPKPKQQGVALYSLLPLLLLFLPLNAISL